MNVLFILADQHNAGFTGCYGGITRTPNLDALASEGTVFERAYTPSPMCAPARACLFSGKYVHENKCWDNCFPYDGEKLPGWGHYFREKGVHLATIGKLDFAADRDNGVESVYEPDNRTSYDVVSLFRKAPLLLRPRYHMVNNWDVSLRETDEHLEGNIVNEVKRWFREEMPADRSWILNVNFSKPHSPWHPLPDKYRYYRDKIELSAKYRQPEHELNPVDREQSRHTCGFVLDEEHLKDCHAAYHAVVEEHDENVGAVIQALKEAGQYEDTLIIYSADHGEMLRAHGAWEKSTMYEDSIRIPMIVKLPNSKGKDEEIQSEGPKRHVIKRVKAPVSLLDIFPTVNEFLGFEKQEGFRGDSLISLINGTDDGKGRAVISESHANGRITGTFAVIKNQWKLMYYDGNGAMLFSQEEDPDEMNPFTGLNHGMEWACFGEPEDLAARKTRSKITELMSVLGDEDGLHKISQDAFAAQEALKDELYQSGRLEKELNKRGFHFDGKELFYLP